jgi:hypothetical protein
MNAAADAETLIDVYRTALTSEIMDAKQSEYYSDYSIFGMADGTETEMKANTQPDPSKITSPLDVIGVANSEMWFYEEVNAGSPNKRIIKFRMRTTDDQKQVVTAGPLLYNRLISDDCETSASFIIGIHKSFMGIRAYMVQQGVWNDTVLDHDGFITKDISEEIVTKLTGCSENGIYTLKVPHAKVSNEEEEKPPRSTFSSYKEVINLF